MKHIFFALALLVGVGFVGVKARDYMAHKVREPAPTFTTADSLYVSAMRDSINNLKGGEILVHSDSVLEWVISPSYDWRFESYTQPGMGRIDGQTHEVWYRFSKRYPLEIVRIVRPNQQDYPVYAAHFMLLGILH